MDIDVNNIKQEDDTIEIKKEPIENDAGSVNEFGLCEPCKGDDIVTKAEGKCKECDDSMCSTCFRHHRKAKSCRYHTLVQDITEPPVSEENGTRIKCKYHCAEKIEFYCNNHESIGCIECIESVHKDCRTELIEILSTNFHESDNLKSLNKKLSDLTSAFRECEKKRRENKTENEIMHAEALAAVKKLRKDFENYLDIEERCIISELENLKSGNSTELENFDRDCKAILSKIERLKQKLDIDIYRGDELFINSVKCKLYLPGLEKALAKVKSGENIRNYEFVPEKYFSDFLNSSKHIGHFETSSKKSAASDELPSMVSHEKQSATSRRQRSTATAARSENTDSFFRGNKRKRIETRQSNAVKAQVGSRVRPGPCFTYDWDHRNKPGTVTSLEPDGTVTVEWDATGKSWSGYRVGAVWNGVELI